MSLMLFSLLTKTTPWQIKTSKKQAIKQYILKTVDRATRTLLKTRGDGVLEARGKHSKTRVDGKSYTNGLPEAKWSGGKLTN